MKTALRMNDSSKAFATTNIGLVRTNARGKAKSGRKQPRPGDIKISERDDEPAQKTCFRPTTDTFIQILNTHPKGGGLHWVTASTYENPVSGAVKLYDSSLALGVSTSIEMSVSNMLRSPESSISIKLMNSDIQPNTNDCGVYAIAFAVSLAFGKEPAYFHFENSKIRSHLLNCLQSGVLTEFPCKPEKRKSLYVQAHTVPLYCTCRMPESDLMFQCTKCQRWFHPN